MLAWFEAWLMFWNTQQAPRSVDELVAEAVRLHRERPFDGPPPTMTMTKAELNLLADHFNATIEVGRAQPPEFMGLPVRVI